METIDFAKLMKQDVTGAVWAMPTDTIPGLSCLAQDPDAVNRIDHIKQRTPDKSYIVLIGSIDQLSLFGVTPSDKHRKCLNRFWPGPVSIVIPGIGQEFSHLDGVVEGLAFRLPDNPLLQKLCEIQGPIISTSANLTGQPALKSLDEIEQQFSDQLDYLVDETWPIGEPSTLIKILR